LQGRNLGRRLSHISVHTELTTDQRDLCKKNNKQTLARETRHHHTKTAARSLERPNRRDKNRAARLLERRTAESESACSPLVLPERSQRARKLGQVALKPDSGHDTQSVGLVISALPQTASKKRMCVMPHIPELRCHKLKMSETEVNDVAHATTSCSPSDPDV